MKLKILILLFLPTYLAFSQGTCDDFPTIICNQFDKNHEPTNLNDAILYMECIWGEEDLEKLKSYENQDEATQLYLQKKMFCTKQKLPSEVDSKLTLFFWEKLEELDFSDIEDIIFNSLHRKLNGNEINLEEQIQNYKKYYAEMYKIANDEYLERRNRDFEKFKIGDIVEFSYKHYFIERPLDCKLQAFVTEIDSTEFMLKLTVIENCETGSSFTIVQSKIYLKENEKYNIKSEEIINLIPNGEIIWTPYYYWKKVN